MKKGIFVIVILIMLIVLLSGCQERHHYAHYTGYLLSIKPSESSISEITFYFEDKAISLDSGDERAVEPLIELLKDNNINIRQRSVDALGAIGDKRAVVPLIELLKDEDNHIRQQSVAALGAINDKRAIEPLIKVLKDDGDWGVREQSEYALVKIGKEAVEPLIGTLNDGNDVVRLLSAEALGKIGDKRALPSLKKALKDEQIYVIDAVRKAIKKIV